MVVVVEVVVGVVCDFGFDVFVVWVVVDGVGGLEVVVCDVWYRVLCDVVLDVLVVVVFFGYILDD